MFGGAIEPVFQSLGVLVARGPVLVFHFIGWIYDTGNVPGAGKDKLQGPAHQFCALENGFCRCDMVFPGCQFEDRQFNIAEIECGSLDGHVAFGKGIVIYLL